VALTGGIGSGKSTCLRRFADLGVPTIDADVLARAAVAPGTPGLQKVVERFGEGVLQPTGELDREALGRLVFADAGARHDLEAIVHPAVYRAIADWFERCAQGLAGPSTRRPGVAVADIPLLYETGHERDVDRVVVAACRPDQQLTRLMARDGLPESEARRRIAAQIPLGLKADRADYVIDTSGSLDDTHRQVIEVWERLRAESV
jgi:dephospho-CoA kinase